MLQKIKAIECVLDWNLWPRQSADKLDTANVRQMKEALEAGIILPPVIVSQSDMRVIDGFHRVTAHLELFGDDAEIEADIRLYSSEKEMFLDAGRYNAKHGLPMSPKDRVHFIIKARKMRIPAPEIAKALGMLTKGVKEFLEKRSAIVKSTGERIPLSYGAAHLSDAEHGKPLNSDQEHYARTANGNVPMMHARLLLAALRADCLKLRESDISLLIELQVEIGKTIGGAE